MKNLSVRQRQICVLLSRGRLYKEIADDLQISENIVRNELKLVYARHGCRNRTEFSLLFRERAELKRERRDRELRRQIMHILSEESVHFRLFGKT